MDLFAKTSGCAVAASVVSGSSGQPGAAVAYPASSKICRHGSQLLGRSQRPWTKTTGCLPVALTFSISSTSYSVQVGAGLSGVVAMRRASRAVRSEASPRRGERVARELGERTGDEREHRDGDPRGWLLLGCRGAAAPPRRGQ